MPIKPTINESDFNDAQKLEEAKLAISLINSGAMELFLNTMYPEGNLDVDEFQFMINLMLPEKSLENVTNLAEGADPIILSNAAYGFSSTDIVLPGKGMPIVITRFYNSKCEYNSRYGNGWDMNYNMKVRPLFTADDPETTEIDESQYIWEIMLLDGTGKRYVFSRDDETVDLFYLAGDRSQCIMLVKDDTQQTPVTHPYALIKKTGECYYFNDDGNLVRIEDRNGNWITLTYESTKTELYGFSRHFEDDGMGQYNDMRGVIMSDYKLTQITDAIGNTVTFSYYGNSDSNGAEGLLKTITDQKGGRTWSYKYDVQYNNLMSIEKPEVGDPDNPGYTYIPKITYGYDNSAFPSAITSIVDAERQQETPPAPYLQNLYSHNPETLRSQVTGQIYGDADSGEFSILYDNWNNRAIAGSRQKVYYDTYSRRDKSVTVTAYNDKGQTVSETVASSPNDDGDPVRSFMTAYEYNEYNEVSKIILPKRNCIEYIYEGNAYNPFNIDRLTVVQRPENDVLPLDGVSDYVVVSDMDGLYAFGSEQEDFSVAFWVKRQRKDTVETLFDRRDASGYGWHLYFKADNTLEFQMLDNTNSVTVASDSVIEDSLWHYIVVSVNRNAISGSINIYINGGLAEPQTPVSFLNPEITSNASVLYFGSTLTGMQKFKGSLDEVMILNRALSREKADKYSIFGLSEYSQGLLGYWKLDETSGTTVYDVAPKDGGQSASHGMTNRDISSMLAVGKVAGEIKIVNTYVQHNDLDYLRTMTDSKGNTTSYTYDFDDPILYGSDVGNLMKVTYPQVDVYERDGSNLILSDPQPAIEVEFAYNNYGQIEMTVGTDDLVVTYQYYDDLVNDSPENYGRLKYVIVDPAGQAFTTEYMYDQYGNVNWVKDAEGNVSQSTYNALNQLVEAISALNTGASDPYYKTILHYNKNGKLNRIKQNFLDGQMPPVQQTQQVEYEYNLLDALKLVRDSLGYESEMFYDDNENLIAVQDAESRAKVEQDQYFTDMVYDERDILSVTIDAEEYGTIYSYDANGNLKTITDAKNQITNYSYDHFDRLILTQYPDESTDELAYDQNSNIITRKNRANNMFYYDYDALNRLVRKITDDSETVNVLFNAQPATISGTWNQEPQALGNYGDAFRSSTETGAVCRFGFTMPAAGTYVAYIWWPKGETTAADNVTVTFNDSGSSSVTVDQSRRSAQWNELGIFTFSSTSAIVDIVAQGSSKTTYADAVRLVPVSLLKTEYYYDIAGRVLQIDDGGNLMDYFYDSLGRLDSVVDQASRTVGYGYDSLGRQTRLDYPDGTFITYHYDALSRLTDIKDQNGIVIAHYDYDELSRRKTLYYNYDGDSLYNEAGVDGFITYDFEDKVESPKTNNNLGNRLQAVINNINGTDIITVDYAYDRVGNVRYRSYDGTATWQAFDYDRTYQLTLADYAAGWFFADESFSYDALGSRDAAMGYTANLLNQYTVVGSDNYTYDDNGNLEFDGQRTFSYDAQNRLESVTFGDTLVEYGYDIIGRRIWKQVTDTSMSEVTSYIEYAYNGMQVIAEYEDLDFNSNCDNLARKFIYGPGIDEPICMVVYDAQGTETGRYFYHFDALGSVIALSQFNSSLGFAQVVERYVYSAFGKTEILDSNFGIRASSLYNNPYRFTGRRWDDETGLYYYRARTYSPDLGRFLQPDPIGYDDGMNMYAYVGNNPLVSVDPTGKMKTFHEYTGSIAVVTYVQNGVRKQVTLSSPETIKHILLNATISGEQISFFEYVGHGYEGGGGLAVGSGIHNSTIENDWKDLVKAAFANNAIIELEACYSALMPDWGDNSIAGSFKSLLPNAAVYGYTGPAKPSFFFAEWVAESHASRFDLLGALRVKIAGESWGIKGNKGHSIFRDSKWIEVKGCK